MADAEQPTEKADQEPADGAPTDWFHRIPFNPKVGLDAVLPMALPRHPPESLEQDGERAERRVDPKD
jgi:hypothetical protein